MADTRTLAPLLYLVERSAGEVLLVGDPGQLPAVGAGGLYPALCERLGAIELNDNRRQRELVEREALARLRAGDPEPYLAHAARHGRLAVDDDPIASKQRLLADWWQTARRDGAGSVMVAYRREDVRDLNQAAHELMLRSGRLGREGVTLGDREFRAGDRVLCRQNDARLGVRHGTRGTIVDLDPVALTLRTDSGCVLSLPPDYAAEQLDYAYALTGHAAQGATVERAHVLLHDQGALREWGYVACPRARAETRLYLADGAIERETALREPATATPPERAARALTCSSVEPLAFEQARASRDATARLLARQRERLDQQRARAEQRLAAARRELEHLGWRNRHQRRLELQTEIAFQQNALQLADEKRAELESTPPRARRRLAPPRDPYELARSRSLQRDLAREQEPPRRGIAIELDR